MILVSPYQEVTDPLILSRAPGSFRRAFVPCRSDKPDRLAR
jgi:hypothetical protein